MSKRKRDSEDDLLNSIEDQALRIKSSRLKAKVDNGITTLAAALKLARGFERQKMGRRQKQASQEPQKLGRLREEVIILRELDPTAVARNHLFKQMIKTRRIRDSAAFTVLYGTDAQFDAPKSPAEANVLALLFKANPVKQALPGIVKDIQQVVGIGPQKSEAVFNTSKLDSFSPDLQETQHEKQPTELGLFDGFSDSPQSPDGFNALNMDTTDDDGVFAATTNARLASSSDEGHSTLEELPDRRSDEEFSGEEESEAENESQQDEATRLVDSGRKPRTVPRLPEENKNFSSTAFLPSLSMGGYYSGSESGSDYDDIHSGPALPKPRKNRRGQRERQKIAEKKYGKNAKHLQQVRTEKSGKTDGWDARRGAVEVSDKRPKGYGRRDQHRIMQSRGPSGANDEPVVAKSRQKSYDTRSQEPLHPSWQAAKKKKSENRHQLTAFTGKKITFD